MTLNRRQLIAGGVAGVGAGALGVYALAFGGDESLDAQTSSTLREFAVLYGEWLDTVTPTSSRAVDLVVDLRELNAQVLAATSPTTTTLPATTTTATTTTLPDPVVSWPGHQPAATYIGLNGTSATLDHPEAAERWFSSSWTGDATEHTRITLAHAADRLPWVSFKPPSGGWAAVANGSADAHIRTKARRYAAYTAPVLATFHHEPWGDGTPAAFEAAFFHILDVMEDETDGDLGATTFCPIFNGHNLHIANEGGAYFTSGQFAERCPFIGFDNYAKAPDIQRSIDALLGHDARTLGVGEFGRGPADDDGPPTPAPHTLAEFEAKLDVFRDHRDVIAVVCYWNSPGNPQDFAADPYPNGPAYRALWSTYQTETCRLSDL